MVQNPPVGSLHVVPKLVRRHHYAALAATYPFLLPLLEFGALSCLLTLVCLLSQLPIYESDDAGSFLGLPYARVQSNPLKHPHKFHQRTVHPDWVSPQDSAIIRIKYNFLIPRCPSHPMVGSLDVTDLHQGGLHYIINQYIEDGGLYRVPLVHPPLHFKRSDVVSPAPW